jgi:ubiquinone/menaquinone biosynthesis C-methylase UbiE
MAVAAEHPTFAWFYEILNRPCEYFGLDKARRQLVGELRGRVLEVGVGNGLNLRHYPSDTFVAAIEPDPHMLIRAIPRAKAAPARINLLAADGQALPFRSGAFDAVVACLVLCTIPDAAAAVAEMRRVIKPGGTLHFFEHIRARGDFSSSVQDALDPLWARTMGGCHLNRATPDTIARAGFKILRFTASAGGIMIRGHAVGI